MSRPLILVSAEGETPVWHIDIDPGANYGTLCALSLDDGVNVASDEKPSAKQKCECVSCFELWNRLMALKLKRSDFV